MGVTLVFFQSSGKMPLDNDLLNIFDKGSDIILATQLINWCKMFLSVGNHREIQTSLNLAMIADVRRCSPMTADSSKEVGFHMF